MLTLEQLDTLRDSQRTPYELADPLHVFGQTLTDLIEYARERAAREACERAIPGWKERMNAAYPDEGFDEALVGIWVEPCANGDRVALWDYETHDVQTAMFEAPSLTEAYLALLAELER